MKAKKMFFTLLGLLLFTNVSAGPTKVLYAEFSDTDNNGSNETMTLKCSDTAPDGAYAYSNGWSSLSGNNNISQNDIVNVFVDGSCANYDGTALQYLFWQFPNLTTITGLTNLNTNSVESMRSMFEGCPELTSLDLSSFNTSNVTDMNSMFSGCTKLETIYVSRGWTTDKVSGTKGDNMFKSCSNLRGSQGSTLSTYYGYNVDYAHIDATNYPGYLTERNSIIRLGNNIDNSSIITAFDGLTNSKVELSGRTLNKDKWNTLCVPFDISDPTTVFGTGVKVKTLSGYTNDGTTVTISFTDAATIEAGKPYIVMLPSGADDMVNPQFSGVTISNAALQGITAGDATFKGNYAPVALAKDDKTRLFLSSNKLYYPTAAVTVKPFRAYFELTSDVPTASGAPNLVIDFGETTGVGELRTENRRIENSFYDLQGRRLNGKPTQKGIYIHHGKKEVLK
jgi:surface protein